MIFGVLCDDTLPPYPEEESGHYSLSTPGNAGQGVPSLCMGPAGTSVSVSERQTLLSLVSPLCCCFCYVCLGLLWFLATSLFLMLRASFLQGDYMCRWIAMSVVCTGAGLNLPMSSLKRHIFRKLSLATLNGIAVPSPTSQPFPKAPVTISSSVYLLLLFVDLLLTLPS